MEAVHILCAVRSAEAVRRISQEMDDGEHCLFEIVHSGSRAVERCMDRVPEILVVDAILPEVDGLGVVDLLRGRLGSRMPRVVGGAPEGLSQTGFFRRGAAAVVQVPWHQDQLRSALEEQIWRLEAEIDWDACAEHAARAGSLLRNMGMNDRLKGFAYLSWAAALVYGNEKKISAVNHSIYKPLAEHFGTTKENVERLIRHAVESTMSGARAKGVYSLFGNTIDPAKGKPTNAQIIALLAQRMKILE